MRKKYGMTLAEVREFRDNGECEICGSKEKLHIDHCHTAGHIRGVLCTNCNTGLGQFSEDISRMKAAIAYVEKHRAKR